MPFEVKHALPPVRVAEQPARPYRPLGWPRSLVLGAILILPLILHPILPGLIDGLLWIICTMVLFIPMAYAGVGPPIVLQEEPGLLLVSAGLAIGSLLASRSRPNSEARSYLLLAWAVATLLSWFGQIRLLDPKPMLLEGSSFPAAVFLTFTGLVLGLLPIGMLLVRDLEAQAEI